jgi:uncharacterized protein
MSNVILSVVVGSRLHGLNNESSDYDIRGIFMHPLRDLVSPFKSLKNTSWIEGDEDNTAYELRDFCKYAAYGNPTILEILWSNMVRENSLLGEELQANRHRFLDSKRIFEAHKGYAQNQYNKMNMFEPDARTPKFCVAYIRSLVQGMQLLESGTFECQVGPEWRDFLLDVKYHFRPELVPTLAQRFSLLQVQFADCYAKHHDRFTPDYEWIEDFLYRAYTGGL